MDRATAHKLLAELASDSGNVVITYHAQERMEQRGITFRQVVRCLEKGYITEGPAPDQKGGWRFTIETVSAGDQLAVVGAITSDAKGKQSVVITAYYPGQ